MYRVSVCMASYNGEKFIKAQIESILIQLSENDELIISDDGSTDDTIAIVNSFQDSRIKVFANNNCKGPVGNFENALSKAAGEIIFLADQDDIWLSNKLNTHLALHQNNDLVISDALVVTLQGAVLHPSFFNARGSKRGFISNILRNSYTGCLMSFNRKILDLALPFPKQIHMHDWWIGLVAELKGTVVFCDEKLMHYVRHQSNASPTLSNSGYSFVKRLNNRLQLIYALLKLS